MNTVVQLVTTSRTRSSQLDLPTLFNHTGERVTGAPYSAPRDSCSD